MSESSGFYEERKPESSRVKMKSAREVSSDETVHEARIFERFNVNLRSASDVKSQSPD